MSQPFIHYTPTPEDCWRGIVLFGRNVATYKFALARALLDLKPPSGRLVKLEELAQPFAHHLCEHLKTAGKQGTSQQSRFLDVCRRAIAGEISQQALTEQTARLGFNNVIDAFHVVGTGDVPIRFFADERSTNNGIRATDALSQLMENHQAANLPIEADARWRLVETAWDLGLSRALLTVQHDCLSNALFVLDPTKRRRTVTGARSALSGYQKGHCFYCSSAFNLHGPSVPDVDHFFPNALKSAGFDGRIDGIWNLVLACPRCNRGSAGKSDRIPTVRLLERLHSRNEFLIASHHPLRETLIAQTGNTESSRRSFLNSFHAQALRARLITWHPQEIANPLI